MNARFPVWFDLRTLAAACGLWALCCALLSAQNPETSAPVSPTASSTAAAAAIPRTPDVKPVQPAWYPLPDDHRQYLEQLLDYWQKSSEQIRQCTCDFRRWDYDPTYCNYRHPQTGELAAYAVWSGEIRFAAPDKALLETREVWHFKLENDTPALESADHDKLKIRWMCDGQTIYDYNYTNKILTDIPIPAEYQGEGLINSPLPFLFGANRAVLQDRFWIRVITPEGTTDAYWLEAVPKRLEDVRTFSRVEIIIAQDDFLPRAMTLYSPNYDPKSNPISQTYVFDGRKINGQMSRIQDFLSIFIRPSLPIGWSRVVQQPLSDDSVTAQRESLQPLK